MNAISLDELRCIRIRAAAVFGLRANQMLFYGELNDTQIRWVAWTYNEIEPAAYVYAVSVAGNMVPRRERIRPEWRNEISV